MDPAQVSYGPTAPFGERSFFAVARQDNGISPGALDCATRGAILPLDQAVSLVTNQVPGTPFFLYGTWQTGEDGSWFQVVADTDRGRIQVDSTRGLLESWHLPRDASIDP